MKNILRNLPSLLLRRRVQIICILAGLLLYFAAVRLQPAETDLKSGRYLPRNSYGGRTQHYEIEVEGLGEGPVPIDVPVEGRIWLDSEVGKAYEACMQQICETLLAGNPSPAEVRTALSLPTTVPDYGISISWNSSEPDVIDYYGKVHSEDLAEPAEVLLTAHLSAAGTDVTEDFVIPLTVLPRQRTAEEQLLEDFGVEDGSLFEKLSKVFEGQPKEMLKTEIVNPQPGKFNFMLAIGDYGHGFVFRMYIALIIWKLCTKKPHGNHRTTGE